jgi:hypothetical protein
MKWTEEKTQYQPDQLVRRYTPGGQVAHLIPEWDWSNVTGGVVTALCGWWGQSTYWRGSGGQDEYDQAAELPTCRKCGMWVRRTNLDIGRAITIAAQVHRGQLDKAGKPYLSAHVADVAERVRKADPQDDEGIVVAWLHDTLEDTSDPFDVLSVIRDSFPAEIAEAVVAITHRQGEPRDVYYIRVKANPIALRVKLHDIASNTDPKRTALLDEPTRRRLALKYAHALDMLR